MIQSGSGGVTCQDKQVILETHNRLRQMLALGQIRGQPASLDMRELVRLDNHIF